METKTKVLVIDDARFILSATKMLLTGSGFEVKTAEDPLDGMKIWRQWKPDLVLLDLMMPEKSGWEVLEEMRLQKDYEDIPVFIFSAKDDPYAKREAKERGASGFILKPFDHEELVRIIKEAVSKAEAKP